MYCSSSRLSTIITISVVTMATTKLSRTAAGKQQRPAWLMFLLAVLGSITVVDACDVDSLEPFKVVFIGNSIAGGANVGGMNSDDLNNCLNNPVPWPGVLPSTNPGDVPGKVKQISDTACQFNFQWNQNTRSLHSLSTHAGSCKLVNENMIAKMGADLNVLVVQAQSEELVKDTCEPTRRQARNLTILLDLAPANSKKMLSTTWARYDTGDEICTFSKLNCTEQDLKDKVSVQILPVGQSFQYIADGNCKTITPCECDTTATCGYVSSSCSTSLWSDSGDGIFADYIHPSEASGAWLAALVTYGGMQTPVCLPSPALLAPSGLSNDAKTELATAAAFALTEEYGSDQSECSISSPTLSPTREEATEEGTPSPTVHSGGSLPPVLWRLRYPVYVWYSVYSVFSTSIEHTLLRRIYGTTMRMTSSIGPPWSNWTCLVGTFFC